MVVTASQDCSLNKNTFKTESGELSLNFFEFPCAYHKQECLFGDQSQTEMLIFLPFQEKRREITAWFVTAYEADSLLQGDWALTQAPGS